MRIAFILNTSSLYGANRSFLGLLRYLKNTGNACFVILPNAGKIENELIEMQIEYRIMEYRACVVYPGYIGLPWAVNLVKLPGMIKTVRNWDVDIIHTNSSSHDIGMILSRILGKKHVWHVREIMEHNYRASYIFPKLYKKLRYESDAVICVSDFIYQYHLQKYPNPNMHMIYNPYDIKYYDIQRNEFAPNEVVRLLMSGNFTAYKRQMDSVKAVNILVKRGVRNIKLTLAGNGEKNYENEVKEYIRNNNLEQYIELVGFVDDLRELRCSSDISLCCSVDEALPRVVVEGMLGELLEIGADSGGIAELIKEGKTGLVYEVGNPEKLADKIEYALENRQKCFQMIKNAKEYAMENFELNKSGARVVEVYKRILN